MSENEKKFIPDLFGGHEIFILLQQIMEDFLRKNNYAVIKFNDTNLAPNEKYNNYWMPSWKLKTAQLQLLKFINERLEIAYILRDLRNINGGIPNKDIYMEYNYDIEGVPTAEENLNMMKKAKEAIFGLHCHDEEFKDHPPAKQEEHKKNDEKYKESIQNDEEIQKIFQKIELEEILIRAEKSSNKSKPNIKNSENIY